MQARILAGECDWEMMDEMLLQGVPFSVFTQSVIDNREHKEFSVTSKQFHPWLDVADGAKTVAAIWPGCADGAWREMPRKGTCFLKDSTGNGQMN